MESLPSPFSASGILSREDWVGSGGGKGVEEERETHLINHGRVHAILSSVMSIVVVDGTSLG